MTSPPARRRRLTPDERRSSIVAAAAEAFAARPVEAVTVAEIAELAGTSEALVYHYLPSRAELYAAAVTLRLSELTEHVTAALTDLPANTSARDATRAYVLTRLVHTTAHRAPWATRLERLTAEPPVAREAREDARAAHVALLENVLEPGSPGRDHYALVAFLAVVDATASDWVERGCPETERWDVVEVALGTLQGALGDWRR